jgi:hypothetical protein
MNRLPERRVAVAAALIGLGFVLIGAITELAGLAVGAVAWRLAATRSVLLRAAVLAQTTDLVTFAFVWRGGSGERNTLAVAALEAAQAVLPPEWAGLAAAALLLLLKLALIVYLVRVAPLLDRYRGVVLIIATAAGLVGATTNVVGVFAT